MTDTQMNTDRDLMGEENVTRPSGVDDIEIKGAASSDEVSSSDIDDDEIQHIEGAPSINELIDSIMETCKTVKEIS